MSVMKIKLGIHCCTLALELVCAIRAYCVRACMCLSVVGVGGRGGGGELLVNLKQLLMRI